MIWNYKIEDIHRTTSPAIYNGKIYFGVHTKADPKGSQFLCGVDANNGEEKWKFLTPTPPASIGYARLTNPVANKGVVYFGSECGNLFAIDAGTGRQKWMFSTDAPVFFPPAISEGVAYFGSHDGIFYAVDVKSGKEKWRLTEHCVLMSAPIVINDTIILNNFGKVIFVVDIKTRKIRCSYEADSQILALTTMDDGRLFLACEDGTLYALSIECNN